MGSLGMRLLNRRCFFVFFFCMPQSQLTTGLAGASGFPDAPPLLAAWGARAEEERRSVWVGIGLNRGAGDVLVEEILDPESVPVKISGEGLGEFAALLGKVLHDAFSKADAPSMKALPVTLNLGELLNVAADPERGAPFMRRLFQAMASGSAVVRRTLPHRRQQRYRPPHVAFLLFKDHPANAFTAHTSHCLTGLPRGLRRRLHQAHQGGTPRVPLLICVPRGNVAAKNGSRALQLWWWLFIAVGYVAPLLLRDEQLPTACAPVLVWAGKEARRDARSRPHVPSGSGIDLGELYVRNFPNAETFTITDLTTWPDLDDRGDGQAGSPPSFFLFAPPQDTMDTISIDVSIRKPGGGGGGGGGGEGGRGGGGGVSGGGGGSGGHLPDNYEAARDLFGSGLVFGS